MKSGRGWSTLFEGSVIAGLEIQASPWSAAQTFQFSEGNFDDFDRGLFSRIADEEMAVVLDHVRVLDRAGGMCGIERAALRLVGYRQPRDPRERHAIVRKGQTQRVPSLRVRVGHDRVETARRPQAEKLRGRVREIRLLRRRPRATVVR